VDVGETRVVGGVVVCVGVVVLGDVVDTTGIVVVAACLDEDGDLVRAKIPPPSARTSAPMPTRKSRERAPRRFRCSARDFREVATSRSSGSRPVARSGA
jgi:hypothetical protein